MEQKICPFMSTATEKVECTPECMLCQADSVPIRCTINDIADLLFQSRE